MHPRRTTPSARTAMRELGTAVRITPCKEEKEEKRPQSFRTKLRKDVRDHAEAFLTGDGVFIPEYDT